MIFDVLGPSVPHIGLQVAANMALSTLRIYYISWVDMSRVTKF